MTEGPHPAYTAPEHSSPLWNKSWPIWLLLALPAVPMFYQFVTYDSTRWLVRGSGEWAARFAIVSLMLTPLMIAFPKVRAIRWLMHHRREIGMAAFLYAVVHLALIASRGTGLTLFSGGLAFPPALSGWIAFVLFAILAATSNDWCVHHMGLWWKRVQRLTYVAAIAFAIHWFLLERDWGVLFFHFGPLLLLEAYRIGWHLRLRSSRS